MMLGPPKQGCNPILIAIQHSAFQLLSHILSFARDSTSFYSEDDVEHEMLNAFNDQALVASLIRPSSLISILLSGAWPNGARTSKEPSALLAALSNEQIKPSKLVDIIHALIKGGVDVDRSDAGTTWDMVLDPIRHTPAACKLLLKTSKRRFPDNFLVQFELAIAIASAR